MTELCYIEYVKLLMRTTEDDYFKRKFNSPGSGRKSKTVDPKFTIKRTTTDERNAYRQQLLSTFRV